MAVPGTAKYSRAWPAGFDEGTEYLASYKILPDGKKVRVCKHCGAEL